MITVCAGWTLGGAPPMPANSAGSGPRSAASGMPWTLPLCDVAGVFMSPCASIHSRPIGSCFVVFAHSAEALTDPAARLWSPPSTSGSAPSASDARALSYNIRHTCAMSPMNFLRSSERSRVSGIGDGRSPLSTTGTPRLARRSPRPAIRSADGPMSTPRRLPPRSRGTPMM